MNILFHESKKSLSKAVLQCAFVVAASAAALAPTFFSSASATTLTISADKRSDIKGWGVNPSFFNGSKAEENYFGETKPQIRDAVYGLGQSLVRLELSGGYYKSGGASVGDVTFSTNAAPAPGAWQQDHIDDIVTELNIAKSKGVTKYILSSWSPPDSFKTINTPTTSLSGVTLSTPIRYGKAQLASGAWVRTRLRQDKEAAFCNWYVAGIKYLVQQTGMAPSTICIQNEPSMWDIFYSGCYWEPDQYYRVAKLMRSTLNANNLSGVIISGHDDTFKVTTSVDHTLSPTPAGIFEWTFPVLDPKNARYDAALSGAIGAYAFHSYDINDQWGTTGGEYTVRTNGGPARDVWMTEWNDHNDSSGDGGGTAEIDFTIKCFRHFACDFVMMPYNYWVYWVAWSKEQGTVNGGDLLGSQNGQPIYSQKYKIFQKIFKTVTPGSWMSKTVASDDAELSSRQDQYGMYQDNLVSLIAFEKNDATASLLVVANPSSSTRSNVVINGLKGSSATVYQTTSSQNMSAAQSGGVSSGRFTISTLPPRSVVLVASQNTSSSPTPTPTPTPTPAPNASNIDSGTTYRIVAVCSGKSLDVSGISNDENAQVWQWTSGGGSNQRWRVDWVGAWIYKITAQNSLKALTISTAGTNNGMDAGARTIQQTYTGAANQQFRIEKMPDGYYRIVAINSGLSLDVAGGSQSDGAAVGQWYDYGNTSQRWRFETP